MNSLYGGNYSYITPTPGTNSRTYYTPQYQTSPQANYMPPQNGLQSMFPQSNLIWIKDKSMINNYPNGRGWQQWFGLEDEQVIYVRETDMNGVTQPLKKITYQIVEDADLTKNVSQPVYDGPSREEFNALADSVKNMTEKLADLLK